MTDKEKQIVKHFRKTRSYAETARLMDPPMTRQNVERYVLRLEARGVALPELLKRGKYPRKKATDDRPNPEA